MTRAELELMWDLRRICEQVPAFVLEFTGGEMTAEAETAFAHRLVDVAETILNHAKARRRLVIDGTATPPDVDPSRRELH